MALLAPLARSDDRRRTPGPEGYGDDSQYGHDSAAGYPGAGLGLVYGDILDFLIDEAALLDDDRHLEWLDCLTDDIVYKMPVRKTVYRRDGDGFDERTLHWDDNRFSLGLRVRAFGRSRSRYDRDPAPRVRRMVTNLAVHVTDKPGDTR